MGGGSFQPGGWTVVTGTDGGNPTGGGVAVIEGCSNWLKSGGVAFTATAGSGASGANPLKVGCGGPFIGGCEGMAAGWPLN